MTSFRHASAGTGHRALPEQSSSLEQLELFPADSPERAGLTAAAARAAVSPGWWPYLATLWAYGTTVVSRCAEIDGVLELAVEMPGEPPESAGDAVAHLHRLVAETCGCCGARPAGPVRLRFDEPTRVVCADCRARLSAGEPFLAVADEWFRLDGSRRVPPGRPRMRKVSEPDAPSENGDAAAPAPGRSLDEPLPPAELRAVIAEIRARMSRELVGQREAVARLALIGGLHVGAALPRGTRVLLVGPSGVGKSTAIEVLRSAVAVPWQLPFCMTDAIDLSAPGWSGAPSIGDLLETALQPDPLDSPRNRRAIIVIDEFHHIRLTPSTDGNMRAKQTEVLTSLLPVLGGGRVHLGRDGGMYDCRQALVVVSGAFTGLDLTRPLTVARLVRWGIPLELANRIAEEIVVLAQLPETDLVALLHRWPALLALVETCARLGYDVRIPDETYARAARVITLGHDASTPRTAGGWLVSALRTALLDALDRPEATELVVAPDALPIPTTATRPEPPDEPPAGPSDQWYVLLR